jgi:hypothetical protein
MSRKVYVKVKTRTLVPVIASQYLILNIDEGKDVEDATNKIIKGHNPSFVDVEDIGIEEVAVEDFGEAGEEDFRDDVIEYLTSDVAEPVPVPQSFEITDSK